MSDNIKKISVVICTYNRCRFLGEALRSIFYQKLDKKYFDLIVVDNNSNDGTADLVNQYKKDYPIKYYFEENQGLSYSRNRGVKESRTEYVAFLDDDAKADSYWLKNAWSIIKNKKPKIFGGPILPFYDSKKPNWFKDDYGTMTIGNEERRLLRHEYLYGSNIFIQRKIFEAIGYFDINIGMKGIKISVGEESELQERSHCNNIKIFYFPWLKVFHLVPKEKMRISYMLKRNIISSNIAYHFLSDGPKDNFKKFIKNCLISVLLFFYFPFRNRKQFPFLKNYIAECYLHRLRSAVWLCKDLMSIFKI